jgi:hypothetical protein
VPNNLTLEGGRVVMGQQGTGRTYLLKLLAHLFWNNQLGYPIVSRRGDEPQLPLQRAILTPLAGAGGLGGGFEAAVAEHGRAKKLIEQLRDKGNVLVLLDEPYIGKTPREQALKTVAAHLAFYALMGARVAVATHEPELAKAAQRVTGFGPIRVNPDHTLTYDALPEGSDAETMLAAHGMAPTQLRAVVKQVGGDVSLFHARVDAVQEPASASR